MIPPGRDPGALASAGPTLDDAAACTVLIHGRGATADSILALADTLDIDGMAWLAPQAPGNTWYPHSFLAPLEANREGIDRGMAMIDSLLERIAEAGIPAERTALAGFSQGACLALEYAITHPSSCAAVAGLSGGLIGPPGTPREYGGSLDGVRVFLGCGDPDPHIPRDRVEESAAVFERMGAEVTMKLYPGLGHSVNDEEMEIVRGMLAGLVSGG